MFYALSFQPEVFGLDISDRSLKMSKLKRGKNFFSLVTFGEEAIKPGIISEGEVKDCPSLSEAIKKAMKEAKGEKLNTNCVVASLPAEKSFLQIIQLPKLSEDEIRKAVFFEAENYVPLPIHQVYLDFQIIPPFRTHLDHTDVLIAALPKNIVDSYLVSLKRAGLKPLALEIESQAIVRALIKTEVCEFPILLIDFGAIRTSFIIFSGYSLRFTTTIQISSQSFTEAISQKLKIGLAEAEELKMKYGLEQGEGVQAGTDISGKSEIFEALIPALTDLTEQIKKYLNYYHTHIFHDHLPQGNREVKKILISGGGASLKGLAEFLFLEIKLPVEFSHPWVNIFPGKMEKSISLPIEKALSFTTALGLALRGVKNKND